MKIINILLGIYFCFFSLLCKAEEVLVFDQKEEKEISNVPEEYYVINVSEVDNKNLIEQQFKVLNNKVFLKKEEVVDYIDYVKEKYGKDINFFMFIEKIVYEDIYFEELVAKNFEDMSYNNDTIVTYYMSSDFNDSFFEYCEYFFLQRIGGEHQEFEGFENNDGTFKTLIYNSINYKQIEKKSIEFEKLYDVIEKNIDISCDKKDNFLFTKERIDNYQKENIFLKKSKDAIEDINFSNLIYLDTEKFFFVKECFSEVMIDYFFDMLNMDFHNINVNVTLLIIENINDFFDIIEDFFGIKNQEEQRVSENVESKNIFNNTEALLEYKKIIINIVDMINLIKLNYLQFENNFFKEHIEEDQNICSYDKESLYMIIRRVENYIFLLKNGEINYSDDKKEEILKSYSILREETEILLFKYLKNVRKVRYITSILNDFFNKTEENVYIDSSDKGVKLLINLGQKKY